MKVDLSPIKRVTSLGKTKQNKTNKKKSPPLFPLKSTIIDIGKKKKKKQKLIIKCVLVEEGSRAVTIFTCIPGVHFPV